MLRFNFKSKQVLKQITRFYQKLYPSEVTIVEVGPRDGLQNEKQIIETAKKVEFIDKLSLTGLKRIEVTSFVSPKWVPQLGDAKQVMQKINRSDSTIRYSTLTPNLKGFQAALEAKTQEVAIFGAASESFTRKNINCSIEESLKQFEQVVAEAKRADIPIRGYVSCVVGCPYEGAIEPAAVRRVVEHLIDMNCYEISLGDTIGVGNPKTVGLLLSELKKLVGAGRMDLFAIHCHDTYGMALVNIVEALEHGVRVVDSSCAGLGGCPYAKGASGNVATEDVIHLLNGLGVQTGVDMNKLLDASQYILSVLNRASQSKVNLAYTNKKK